MFEFASRVTGLKERYGASFFDEPMGLDEIKRLIGRDIDKIARSGPPSG